MTLTATGFSRPRLNDIKASYDVLFQEALGPVNTAPDSVVGQILGIFAAALDDIYEAVQDTYDSMYPFSAEGTSLDGAVAFVGLSRLAASATSVIAMCYGTESTLIPAGSLARSLDNRQYATTEDALVSRANAGDVEIGVVTVANSTAYQIIAGGVSVTYVSDSSATAAEIVAGLAALFNPANYLATVVGDTLRLRAVDLYSSFPLTVGSRLAISKLGSPVLFTALDLGAYALPAGALTRIDSALLGWDTVDNLLAGNIGRFIETDEKLRARHATSTRVIGAATAQAIRARLLAEVESVEYVAVYENRSSAPDIYGLPPHSFETVVVGGLNQAVAAKLFEVKPAGIETYGNVSVTVTDENGDGQVCRFSRPTYSYGWVRVTVAAFNGEEVLSVDTAQAIREAVLAYGQSLEIGDDIIQQRFYGPIFGATSGLGSLVIETAVTAAPGDSPTYATTNISVPRARVVLFDLSRIAVVGL